MIRYKKRYSFAIAALVCMILFGMTGCMDSDENNNTSESIYSATNTEDNLSDASIADIEEKTSEEIQSEVNAEAKDMVSAPIDFSSINNMKLVEENGISYYPIETSEFFPLSLNEWAKINIFTEKGEVVNAYIRFTGVTRNQDEIKAFINKSHETMGSDVTYNPIVSEYTENVLLHCEVKIDENVEIKSDDMISYTAIQYPLTIYSTMESRKFETEYAIENIEQSVQDVSIIEQKILYPGDIIEKDILLCDMPSDYTAYGIKLTYMNIQRHTNIVYFKLEY